MSKAVNGRLRWTDVESRVSKALEQGMYADAIELCRSYMNVSYYPTDTLAVHLELARIYQNLYYGVAQGMQFTDEKTVELMHSSNAQASFHRDSKEHYKAAMQMCAKTLKALMTQQTQSASVTVNDWMMQEIQIAKAIVGLDAQYYSSMPHRTDVSPEQWEAMLKQALEQHVGKTRDVVEAQYSVCTLVCDAQCAESFRSLQDDCAELLGTTHDG